MDTPKRSSLPDRLESLLQTLSEIEAVSERDGGKGAEADVLAYSVLEIEESCRRFLDLLDKLERAEDPLEQLEEMREELRHILYHVRDSSFFRVIEPPGKGAETAEPDS